MALLDQPDGLAPRLLEQADVDPGGCATEMETELAQRPQVSGPGAAPGRCSSPSGSPGCWTPPSRRPSG